MLTPTITATATTASFRVLKSLQTSEYISILSHKTFGVLTQLSTRIIVDDPQNITLSDMLPIRTLHPSDNVTD